MKKLLVGTDGSDTAAKAVEHATRLGQALGAEVLVVHVYPPPRSEGSVLTGPAAPPTIEIGKSILADAERRHGSTATIRTVLIEGDPADGLIDVAEREQVDLIVVGNKGMTGAKRFLLGSVPNKVSHHAPCSVLIVHTA